MTTRLLAELTDHPKNTEIYGDEELDRALVASIEKRGVLAPLLVTPCGTILSGHRRAAAARAAGLEEVPVIERDVADELDALEVIVRSNQQRRKTNWQLA